MEATRAESGLPLCDAGRHRCHGAREICDRIGRVPKAAMGHLLIATHAEPEEKSKQCDARFYDMQSQQLYQIMQLKVAFLYLDTRVTDG